MSKTLTLNEDHIKLIKCINFEGFDFGERYSTKAIDFAIKEILSSEENIVKFGPLASNLEDVRRQLDGLSFNTERHGWGVDQWNLFGGVFVLDEVAKIIGRYNERIEGTENSAYGADYPEETKEYMWSLYQYIWDNMEYIFSLILYFLDKGITPGTYVYKSGVWTKKEKTTKD